MPGVVEETLLAVRAGQPVYVAGGFGGAAGDIAHRLGRWPGGWPALGDGAGEAPNSGAIDSEGELLGVGLALGVGVGVGNGGMILSQ